MTPFPSLCRCGGLLVGFVALFLWAGPLAANEPLAFDVYLDDKPIGTHRYHFTPEGEGFRLVSEARYDVKVLFINAYRYRHRSEEQWRDGCLVAIRSRTDANGDDFRVDAELTDKGLALDTGEGKALAPVAVDCPRSYAYWDRELLAGADQLLNSQTGELGAVRLEPRGMDELPWGGRGEAFVLKNPEADIHLWYDGEGRWLGLRSELDNGRTLSYRPRADADPSP
ncbi:MAG: DUF6134 family protein [Pseudomonadota bacterium]|nr:DUF6134 family protein [Pseudomonadota bacterium]